MRGVAVLVPFVLLLAGCTSPDANPDAAPVTPSATRAGVQFETDYGAFTLVLYPDRMPVTVDAFTKTVTAGGYVDRFFSRVIDNFVIQSSGDDGAEQLPLETHDDIHFAAGVIGMARGVEADSATDVFFVTEYPQQHLHQPEGATLVVGTYAGFGQLVAGWDTVRAIAAAPKRAPPDDERPIEDIHITGVTLIDVPVAADFDRLYPRQVAGRTTVTPFRVSLEHDARLDVGVAVDRFAWFVESQIDRAQENAFTLVMAVTAPDGTTRDVPLTPDEADPNIHHAPGLTFDMPGVHGVTLALAEATAATGDVTFRVAVTPGASA